MGYNEPAPEMKRQGSQLEADLPFDRMTLTFRYSCVVKGQSPLWESDVDIGLTSVFMLSPSSKK